DRLRRSIRFLRREPLARGKVTLHLLSTVPIQRVASMKPIDRCAEKRIDRSCARPPKRVIPSGAKRSRGCNTADEVGEARLSISWRKLSALQRPPSTSLGMTARFHPLLRRLRQIVRREAKFFAQFSVKIFESGSQFGFDSFARLRFLQLCKTRNRFSKRDPDRRAPERQPLLFGIKPIRTQNYTRHDGNIGNLCERCCAWPERCDFAQS